MRGTYQRGATGGDTTLAGDRRGARISERPIDRSLMVPDAEIDSKKKKKKRRHQICLPQDRGIGAVWPSEKKKGALPSGAAGPVKSGRDRTALDGRNKKTRCLPAEKKGGRFDKKERK